MRINIVIDDKLMRDTLRTTGLKTKREAVELGLRTLLRLRRQGEIRRLRGKLDWQGDLDAMRAAVDSGRFQRLDRLLQGSGHTTNTEARQTTWTRAAGCRRPDADRGSAGLR